MTTCLDEALTLDIPGATSGTGEFEVVSGDHLIQMYEDAAGTIPVMYFQSWPVADLPVTRYIRGIDVSFVTCDVELRLTYQGPEGQCEDTMNLTVYTAEFIDQVADYSLDVNNDSDNFFLEN